MKKVLGLGNALTDVLIQVSEDDLRELGLLLRRAGEDDAALADFLRLHLLHDHPVHQRFQLHDLQCLLLII